MNKLPFSIFFPIVFLFIFAFLNATVLLQSSVLCLGFPGGLVVKNRLPMQEIQETWV